MAHALIDVDTTRHCIPIQSPRCTRTNTYRTALHVVSLGANWKRIGIQVLGGQRATSAKTLFEQKAFGRVATVCSPRESESEKQRRAESKEQSARRKEDIALGTARTA
jgi:hypothetical protein